jgi:predicted nuclease of predicted toxin-antitoxin system
MARFLANENVPGEAVLAARQAGHDFSWICEIEPGANDQRVLQISNAEKRVLVTFDRDFGELVFHKGNAASAGIILIRPRLRSPGHVSRFLIEVLSKPVNWEGHFSIAREGRLRIVPMP